MGFMDGMKMIYEFFMVLWFFIKTFWWIFAIAIALSLLERLVKAQKASKLNKRLATAGIVETNAMTGEEFEKWLKVRFEELGYKVELTPVTGDMGADLILHSPKGLKIAVQAKKTTKRDIGPKSIGEVLRGIRAYECDKGMVVTNGSFTKSAKREARACNVELWDRDKLLDKIEKVQEKKAAKLKTKSG